MATIMLAHRKLWESTLNPEGIPTTFPWIYNGITTMDEFDIMEADKWNKYDDAKPEDVLMWQLFFALYFASEETIIAGKNSIWSDKYIEV